MKKIVSFSLLVTSVLSTPAGAEILKNVLIKTNSVLVERYNDIIQVRNSILTWLKMKTYKYIKRNATLLYQNCGLCLV